MLCQWWFRSFASIFIFVMQLVNRIIVLAKVICSGLKQFIFDKIYFFLLLHDKRKKCLINIDELYLQPKSTFCTLLFLLCKRRRIEKFITYANFFQYKKFKNSFIFFYVFQQGKFKLKVVWDTNTSLFNDIFKNTIFLLFVCIC